MSAQAMSIAIHSMARPYSAKTIQERCEGKQPIPPHELFNMIHWAMYKNEKQAVAQILKKDVQFLESQQAYDVLYWVARMGDEASVAKLLRQRCDISDEKAGFAMKQAAQKGHQVCVDAFRRERNLPSPMVQPLQV